MLDLQCELFSIYLFVKKKYDKLRNFMEDIGGKVELVVEVDGENR